jgi:hypothetical protein
VTSRLVTARVLPGTAIDRTGAGILVCGDENRGSEQRVIDVLKRLVDLGFLKPKYEMGRTEPLSQAETDRWWERITIIIEEALYDGQSFTVQSPSGISWFVEAEVDIRVESADVDICHEFDRGQQWLRITIPRGLPDARWAQTVSDLPGVLDLTGVPDLGAVEPAPCVDLESPLEVPSSHQGSFMIETGLLAEKAGVPENLLRAHLLRRGAHHPASLSYRPIREGYNGPADLYVGLTGHSDARVPRAAQRGVVVPVTRPLGDMPPTITWRLRRPPGTTWSPAERIHVFGTVNHLNQLLAA